MLRDRTSFPDHRPQQRGTIDLRPYTPVVAAFFVVIEGVGGGEDVWEVGVCFFVFEEAGEVEDVGAGEGDEDGFVCGGAGGSVSEVVGLVGGWGWVGLE